MKPKLWPILTLLVLVSILFLVGCAPASPEAPKEATAAATEAPATKVPVTEETEPPAEPVAGESVKVAIFVGFGAGTKAKRMEIHYEGAPRLHRHPDKVVGLPIGVFPSVIYYRVSL